MFIRLIYVILSIPTFILCMLATAFAVPVEMCRFVIFDGREDDELSFIDSWPMWIKSQLDRLL